MTDAILSAIFGGLLLLALVLGYPALLTAIRLIRAERLLGRLTWHTLTSIDTAARGGAATDKGEERDGR